MVVVVTVQDLALVDPDRIVAQWITRPLLRNHDEMGPATELRMLSSSLDICPINNTT